MNEKLAFLKFAERLIDSSYGQNIQDLWGLWENRETYRNGYFVEFGALGGINVSNTYLLEQLGWKGIVAEPHPSFKEHLKKNRSCNKSFDAVYSQSNLDLEFKVIKGMPARSALMTTERSYDIDSAVNEKQFELINVKTISLTDLLIKHKAPKTIQFISIDTEGSEYEILSRFDFNKFQFCSICVEYGDEVTRNNIYKLLVQNGYKRKWEDISDHDDWYVFYDRMINQHSSNQKEILTTCLEYNHDLMPRAKKRNTLKIRKAIKAESQKYLPSKSKGLQYRLDLTLKCTDCDYIPKVANAGKVFKQEGNSYQLMHNGVKVSTNGYIGPWMTNLIKDMKGHHEPQEEKVFHEILKYINSSNPQMIELGCYWAYYSCWFKSVFPNGQVICAEPHTKNLEIGKSNIKLNHYDNVSFYHAFSGDPRRVKRLLENDSDNVFSKEFLGVTDLFEIHNLKKLDLLHMDIQGAELDVLEESLHILETKKVKFLIVSTHIHYISGDPLTHQKCLELIHASGGRILAEHDVHESFSGDGLICACYDDSIDIPDIDISYCRYSESFYRNPLYDINF